MIVDIEHKVIKKLSEGDQWAFRIVFEHYYPRVHEFIRRIVKSETIAEDIAQDIFVKIWERREMFGVEVHSFNKYIYVMSRNAAINAIRRTGRVSSLIDETIVNHQENISIEEDYYAREKELIIRLTVCQMPEQRRRIFEMSRYMGMDNQTIATTLNLSKKTVENHLTLALKTLRSVLACWAALFLVGGGNIPS